jgi:tetratricopeptide (TPR) repeat protein
VLIALPVIALLAYLPAIRGGFIWDDDRHVWANHTLLDLRGLAHIWFRPSYLPQWYPMTHTSFWLEYRLWGANPLGYHVDNVLLHSASALLLFVLLRRLNIRGAALAAVIFALHPIEAESVAWISERKNVLSTFFALLSVLAYLRAGDRRWPIGSFLLFALAMLSKTVASTLPAVLLVIVWWREGRVRWKDVLRLLPFFLLSIGLGYFTAKTEVDYVGARGPDWDLSAVQRLMIAGRALWFYLAKLVWPVNLTFSYPRWTVNPHDLWLLAFPLAAVGLAIAAWLLRDVAGRGLLAALLIFAGVLTPALGFFNTYPMRYSFVADHFQYTAGIAIIVLFSAAIVRVFPERILALILVVVLSVLTWRQTQVYAGPETLWRDVIAKNPSSWLALENLGVELTYKPDPSPAELKEAVQLYKRVEQLRPQHEKLQANWAEALFELGEWEEALPHYRAALDSPGASSEVIDQRMGTSLLRLGRLAEAEAMFRQALKLDPSDTAAGCALGDTLAAEGKPADALAEYEDVLKTNADTSAAWRGSGIVLITLKRPEEAADRLRHYVELVPGDAEGHERLGRLDLQLNRAADALKQFAAELAISPGSESGKEGLGEAVEMEGKLGR